MEYWNLIGLKTWAYGALPNFSGKFIKQNDFMISEQAGVSGNEGEKAKKSIYGGME